MPYFSSKFNFLRSMLPSEFRLYPWSCHGEPFPVHRLFYLSIYLCSPLAPFPVFVPYTSMPHFGLQCVRQLPSQAIHRNSEHCSVVVVCKEEEDVVHLAFQRSLRYVYIRFGFCWCWYRFQFHYMSRWEHGCAPQEFHVAANTFAAQIACRYEQYFRSQNWFVISFEKKALNLYTTIVTTIANTKKNLSEIGIKHYSAGLCCHVSWISKFEGFSGGFDFGIWIKS